jgi:hypothetical protein
VVAVGDTGLDLVDLPQEARFRQGYPRRIEGLEGVLFGNLYPSPRQFPEEPPQCFYIIRSKGFGKDWNIPLRVPMEEAFHVSPVRAENRKVGGQIRQGLVGTQEGKAPGRRPILPRFAAVDQTGNFKEFRQLAGNLREKTGPPAGSDYSNPGFPHKRLAEKSLKDRAQIL